MERDQNDTIITPFQKSNKSSLGMILPIAIDEPLLGTTTLIPQSLTNSLSYNNVQLQQFHL